MVDRMLTVGDLRKKLEPGMHPDGNGLYLNVSPSGTRSWIFRFTGSNGKRREMGLGSYDLVPPGQARELAFFLRKTCAEGHDPLEKKRADQAIEVLASSRRKTFLECITEYHAAHKSGWSPKEADDFLATLKNHSKDLHPMPVEAIERSHVETTLRAIWFTKPETAKRLRSRIERVLGYAKIKLYREGDNPAAWRDNLKHVLPTREKVKPVKHYQALPSREMRGFMAELAAQSGNPVRALEFKILTAARSAEALGALWSEIDLVDRVWRIPGERMKAGEPHRVPLSPQAIKLLEFQASVRENEFVFAGNRAGQCLSEMAMIMVIRRMYAPAKPPVTPHGFRSTFKDWASEIAKVENVVSEMALAHVIADVVEAAYRRGDLFERRIELMNTWADFIRPPKLLPAASL